MYRWNRSNTTTSKPLSRAFHKYWQLFTCILVDLGWVYKLTISKRSDKQWLWFKEGGSNHNPHPDTELCIQIWSCRLCETNLSILLLNWFNPIQTGIFWQFLVLFQIKIRAPLSFLQSSWNLAHGSILRCWFRIWNKKSVTLWALFYEKLEILPKCSLTKALLSTENYFKLCLI